MSVLDMSSRVTLGHSAVGAAYAPLASLLRLFGVYPLGGGGGKGARRGVSCLQLLSVSLNALLVLTTLAISVKYDFLDSAITMDESTSIIILWAICLGSLSTLLVAPFKGAQHAALFSKWRQVDGRLRVEEDEGLGRSGRRFLLLFLLLALVFVGTAVSVVFSQRSSTDPATNLVLSLQVLLLSWNYATVALVQTCIYFFCVAIRTRFERLGERVRRALATSAPSSAPHRKTAHVFTLSDERPRGGEEEEGRVDIARELEDLRHDYHLLTEITLDTSAHFSPHILLSFLLDSAILCTSMYRVIKASHLALWCIPLEMLTMLTATLKILLVNMVGDDVAAASKAALQALPKASYKDKSKGSKYQAQFLTMTTSAEEGPAINASGFFTLDRRMFTATLGTVATYFVVLLQFQQ